MSRTDDPAAPDAMVAGDDAELERGWAGPVEPAAAKARPRDEGWAATLRTLGWALLIALLVRTLLFQPFHIPTGSMRPTLLEGDYVIASKFAYGFSRASLPGNPPLGDWRLFGGEPRRGDIVVFRAPQDPGQAYIKRLIGLPGDRISMQSGVLYLNGVAVPQGAPGEFTAETLFGDALSYRSAEEILPGGRSWTILDRGENELDYIEPFEVPAGHYFMLGDNRDESRDSRVPAPEGPGLVPAANLIGRAELVLVSVKADFQLFAPWTWWRVRPARFVHTLEGTAS